MEELKELLRRLQGQVIKRGVEDVMTWRLSKGDTFVVKSFLLSKLQFERILHKHCVKSLGLDESQLFCFGI